MELDFRKFRSYRQINYEAKTLQKFGGFTENPYLCYELNMKLWHG